MAGIHSNSTTRRNIQIAFKEILMSTVEIYNTIDIILEAA